MFSYKITAVEPIKGSIDLLVSVLRIPNRFLSMLGIKEKFIHFRGKDTFWVNVKELEVAAPSWCKWLQKNVRTFEGRTTLEFKHYSRKA